MAEGDIYIKGVKGISPNQPKNKPTISKPVPKPKPQGRKKGK